MSTNPTTDTAPAQRRTRDVIWDAIVDLHSKEQVITRDVLREVTGLRLVVIDDHIKRFIEEEESLRRVRSGVFQPVVTPPPARSVSATEIPGGMLKIEVGDDCISLWPREARALGSLLAGHAQEFAALQATYDAGQLSMQVQSQLRDLQAAVRSLMPPAPPARPAAAAGSKRRS